MKKKMQLKKPGWRVKHGVDEVQLLRDAASSTSNDQLRRVIALPAAGKDDEDIVVVDLSQSIQLPRKDGGVAATLHRRRG